MPARRILVVIVALAALAVYAAFLWLPFDPAEDPAGPIDEMVPRNVDTAWRLDGPALISSPFAVAAWESPEGRELRALWGVEERFLAPVRRAAARIDAATFGLIDGVAVERDLATAEVVVATRGPDVLVATRISRRAKALDVLRRLPADEVARHGLRLDGPYVVVVAGAGDDDLWILRHRDVLFLATSRAFLDDVRTTVSRGAVGLASRPGYRNALRLDGAVGRTIVGWVTPAAAARVAPPATEDAPPPWWAAALTATNAAPALVEIDLSEPAALAVTVRFAWVDTLPRPLDAFRGAPSPDAATLASRAQPFVVPGEAIATGGLCVRASDVFHALLASQPPERQQAFDAALAAAGESPASLARSLSAHVADGAGFVLARVAEADRVLGGADAGAVHAIPATVVVLRLRDPAGAGDALVADLRRRAETIFGAPLGDREEVVAGGARLHTLRRDGLAGQWELLQPAFAIRGDELVFSTHEGHLRRALGVASARTVEPSALSTVPQVRTPDGAAAPSPSCAFAAAVPMVRRWIDDQAWEAADRTTWRDWAAVRREIESAIPPDTPLRPQDVVTYVDTRVRAARRRRVEVEIPDAAAAFRARWDWLSRLGDVQATCAVEATGAALHVRVSLR